MIAGGTGKQLFVSFVFHSSFLNKNLLFFSLPGITPMFQLIKHVLKDPSEKMHMSLLFANQVCEGFV